MTSRDKRLPSEEHEREGQHQQDDQTRPDERRDVGGAPDDQQAEHKKVGDDEDGVRHELPQIRSVVARSKWVSRYTTAPVFTAAAAFLLVSLLTWGMVSQGAEPLVEAEDAEFAAYVRRAERFVVGVGVGDRAGSGWLRNPDGLVVTAGDLVAGVDSPVVTLGDSAVRAWVAGVDTLSGIAVLQVPRKGLPEAPVATESTPVEVGHEVAVVARFRGGGPAAVQGRVAALERTRAGAPEIRRILTSAAGYRDVRGAPLLDWRGRVVGMVAGPEAGAAGLPGAATAAVVDSAIATIRRGANAQGHIPAWFVDAPSQGGIGGRPRVEVLNVFPGNPSQRTLRKGDVIRRMDDTVVLGADTLRARIRARFPNSLVTFLVQRGDSTATVRTVLSSTPGTPSRAGDTTAGRRSGPQR